MVRKRWCSLGVAVLVAGCYRYVPETLEAVPVGTDLRVLVSTEGQVKLLNDFGIDSRSIVGVLETKEEHRVRLAVRALFSTAGPGQPPLYQHVELFPRDLLRIEAKRLDRLKTGAFLGLLAGSAAAIAIMAGSGTFSGGSRPPPSGQPPAR